MPDFVLKTQSQILADYLRDIRLGITGADTREGSLEYARGTALANALMPTYANASRQALENFPSSASEEGLQRFATIFKKPRQPAAFAAGTITVTSSFATTLPDGARLTNKARGTRYKTVGATLIGGTLTATAFVVAVDGGSSNNCDPGTTLTFDGAPPGINPLASVIGMSGGDEQWSNARWAEEILRQIRRAPRNGNAAHLQALAAMVGGIEQVFVYPQVRGAGTLDVCVVTSAASGSRVASTALISRYGGALFAGAKTTDQDMLPGLSPELAANTLVMAAAPQTTSIIVKAKASQANPWGAWPPIVDSTNTAAWYSVASASSLTQFTVTKPSSGTVVAPISGQQISVYFPSVGFAQATITGVTDNTTYWTIVVGGWSPSPTETTVPLNVIQPWCSQLPAIAGAPVAPSLALTGAVPEYFSALGPGEEVALSSTDVWQRRRQPFVGSINPLTGGADYPTDLTTRLGKAIVDATDFVDVSYSIRTGSSTPTVGSPPSILVLGTVAVFPY